MRPFLLSLLCVVAVVSVASSLRADDKRPNIIFILTDDHRWDGLAILGNEKIHTPNLDKLCAQGTRFKNAFVTLAICSPSRAACLTGRYGSANGVTKVGSASIKKGEPTFARALKEAGYMTGVTGKWHLGNAPKDCGFDFAATCWSNGTWYNREFNINGKSQKVPGFVDDVTVDQSLKFISQATEADKPFALFLCTQVPHMDHRHTWPAKEEFLKQYDVDEMPLPETWNDDLQGKPGYLGTSRSRTQALSYGYDDPHKIREHARDYYASVQQMDEAVGKFLDELERRKLRENTWIILMGDNGWMLGEHGFTSKVLPYEASMRVPMAVIGPGQKSQVRDELVLNIDLTASIYQLAGLPVPDRLHGESLLPLVRGEKVPDWRASFLYEAPTPQLGSRPLWAVRNDHWKYIETDMPDGSIFRELYDLKSDQVEATNVADRPENAALVQELSQQLKQLQAKIE
ncbi:sulfatase-like hydrolase/transferase [bacterium]|nr:sulfatase-like hydrolase/transferase [bacterium]